MMSLLTFTFFAIDKSNATRNKFRVPELTLIFLTSIGGWIGGILSMIIFHHKTRKAHFIITVFISALMWTAALVFIILNLLNII